MTLTIESTSRGKNSKTRSKNCATQSGSDCSTVQADAPIIRELQWHKVSHTFAAKTLLFAVTNFETWEAIFPVTNELYCEKEKKTASSFCRCKSKVVAAEFVVALPKVCFHLQMFTSQQPNFAAKALKLWQQFPVMRDRS